MNPALESLKSCQLFRPLPEATLQALLDCSEQRSYLPDETLFIETAEEEDVYLITAGSVDIEISLGNQDASYEIVALGAGEIMGFLYGSNTQSTQIQVPRCSIASIAEVCPTKVGRLGSRGWLHIWRERLAAHMAIGAQPRSESPRPRVVTAEPGVGRRSYAARR